MCMCKRKIHQGGETKRDGEGETKREGAREREGGREGGRGRSTGRKEMWRITDGGMRGKIGRGDLQMI